MEPSGVKRPIQRSIVLGSSLFLLALVILLSVLAYFVLSSALYLRYDTKLENVTSFVEHNADADDLERCIQTGVRSEHYDELQQLMNTLVDDFKLEYLYIVIPTSDVMTNVISATSEAERAAGEDDTALLETTDAYSPEELERYSYCWNADSVSYFQESSDYGEYYTACKPLRNSSGKTIALICADLSLESLYSSLRALFGGSLLTFLVLLGLYGLFTTYWIRKNVTSPLLALERSAQQFASKSHDAEDVSQLEYNPPSIHTGNEVESLSRAMNKVAIDVRAHVDEALAAQARAHDAEQNVVRLAAEAESAAKIAELSQSVTSLLTNMPGLTFSKDAETGVYLACNQAFAEYAHKTDPSGVAGLTDYEIFDSVTAQHFVDDDKTALSMDKPYVFFEDVFDAAGNPKQFHTTKMKFYDTKGRLCTLGMCVDVTELMSAQRDTQEARRAYEEARDASLTFYNIAYALSADYLRLYYVDLDTDEYVSYRHSSEHEDLQLDREGEDFFEVGQDDMRALVYSVDEEAFRNTFTKENVLRSVNETGVFTLTYRVLQEGVPTYMNLKASRIEGDERHLVVGISNVDVQMRQQESAKRMQEEQATAARITALSGDYLAIFAVDPDGGHYGTYSISSRARDVISLREGGDFFEDFSVECERIVHPDDIKMVKSLLVGKQVVDEVRAHGIFAVVFRLMMDETPTYVSLRAALVEERDGPQLIVGISNIDSRVKREREFAIAQNRANRDALTGVKNKHAYVDDEAALDERIASGEKVEFGIVVCDLNNLKVTNDTMGHQAGDARLKEACSIICTVFKHSPVFRIGGDEFAVVLQGNDYEHADELIEELERANEEYGGPDDPIIAWGIATYRGDQNVAAVFTRADEAMYANKRDFKATR